jgi:uncharacterized protein (TIGR02391 family)
MIQTAQVFQQIADQARLGRRYHLGSLSEQFDGMVSDPLLRSVTRGLFVSGHFAQSVEEAFKCLENQVQYLSGERDIYGSSLMSQVFRRDNPKIRLNKLESRSELDEQEGYMHIFMGCMKGIRNPRAHAHGFKDDPQKALEIIILAQHLLRVLREASVVQAEAADKGGTP